MNNKTSLVDSALDLFRGLYKIDIASNSCIDLDDYYIDLQISKIAGLSPNLTVEDLDEIKRKIKSQYAVYQPDGVAILGDYEHFDNWYDELNLENQFFWDRYKGYLLDKGFEPPIVNHLENETLKDLMKYIGNPEAEEPFARKGLVIGDVQSGKTSNYLGLICKAADAGYKVIFLLTGLIEDLRRQTQRRVEEGFIGYDTVNSEDVGVGAGNIVPFAFTSRKQDFVKGSENNTALLIEQGSTRPYIFIIKKNISVLKKIHTAIKRNLNRNAEKVKFPMIMIDDEADNASIDTSNKDNDPTKTNAYIRKILALFEKSNYVGFTATPFANVFIDPDTDDEMLKNDLFPKDFVYALFPPSNYHGAKRMFVDKNENSDEHMLEIIDSNEQAAADLLAVFPINHKKEWTGKKLPKSVYEAIDRFIIVNAIRDIKDKEKNTHRSMLINMSRFTAVQFVITELVEQHFRNTKNDIKQSWKLSEKEYLENPSIARLFELFNVKYKDCGYSWKEIFQVLFDAIKDIDIITVNSDKSASKLDYEEHRSKGYRVIAIGGMALSRGLTLEGLIISYFYRNSATFDVLMQMGRWFGYRAGYEKLCKVYISEASVKYYKEIIESTEQLKSDMKKMCAKKQKPAEYGIRVRNDFYSNLRITAAGKMKCTKQKIVHKDFWGEMFYTPFLDYGEDNIKNVMITQNLVERFASNIDEKVAHPYLRNVDKCSILDFLNSIKMNADINDSFDIKQLTEFIQKQDKIENLDILLMGGRNDKVDFSKSIKIKPVSRQYELVPNTTFIRLNRHRLGGSKDTSHGLSNDLIKKIDKENEGENQKNYLVKDRNPLLIIYMIKPSNKKVMSNGEDKDECLQIEETIALKDKDKALKEVEFESNQAKQEQPYLIGYQIGFPQSDDSRGVSNRYTTNINADYYKLQGSYFDNGEDE